MNDQADWVEINDKHLAATVAWLRLRLERLARSTEGKTKAVSSDEPSRAKSGWFGLPKQTASSNTALDESMSEKDSIDRVLQEMTDLETNAPSPALILLANNLGLSKFDRSVLALCAAMALDTRIPGLCAKAQGDLNKPYPTFALAFALFDEPDWNALSPHGPLRYWRLLEINQPGAMPLTGAALIADERIVNYLKGLNYLDDRLTPLLDPIGIQKIDDNLPPSQQQTVDRIVARLKQTNGFELPPMIELLGHDSASKRLIAARSATLLGLNLQAMDLKSIPGQTGDFETFIRLWQRESLLMPLALYLAIDGAAESDRTLLKRFIERCSGLVFIDLADAKTETLRERITIEVGKPTPAEQERMWDEVLQAQAGDLSKRLAGQFSFDQHEIRSLAHASSEQAGAPSEFNLWESCRVAAREGMEQLAQRIDAKSHWDDLILPLDLKSLLRQITDQVNRRNRVYDDWGFRSKLNRGLGINALFTGESGTGKTMAAEVIANELQLDLFRIDLSAVVSKYIGETEKNLRKLFDSAEDSGAILFFDEADALFGKRSEVKDSHDRYANIEINYLLQRMEAYRGLAILATNMKGALDKAFMRRLRFIVDFPFPGIEERKQIWKRVFPPATPVDPALDYRRLAALNLTGGSIQNVALNAAFLAAQEENARVTMPLILNAARTEFKKMEKPAKESDFRWLDQAEVK
ncbi:ATP-binding protein [Methylotuvimicrobium sp.]|uniref:ATP-binding protein n=1 Tax=Methylotuvimicrobium sp. TaxID=2822413 RepID=UPI003D660B26